MEDAGVPLSYDARKGHYVITPAALNGFLSLSADELVALLWAAYVSPLSGSPVTGPLVHQGIAKVLTQVPARVREEAANLLHSATQKFSDTTWPEGKAEVFHAIMTALRRKRSLRVIYHQAHEGEGATPIRTKIIPTRLVAARGGWHLIGRSSWHRKVCDFDIRNVAHAEQVGEAEGVS